MRRLLIADRAAFCYTSIRKKLGAHSIRDVVRLRRLAMTVKRVRLREHVRFAQCKLRDAIQKK